MITNFGKCVKGFSRYPHYVHFKVVGKIVFSRDFHKQHRKQLKKKQKKTIFLSSRVTMFNPIRPGSVRHTLAQVLPI